MQLVSYGLVNFVNAMEIKVAMDAAMDQGDFVIDCEGVKQIDSTMVSLVLHALRRAKKEGKKVRLQHEPKGFFELVALYGIEEAFVELERC